MLIIKFLGCCSIGYTFLRPIEIFSHNIEPKNTKFRHKGSYKPNISRCSDTVIQSRRRQRRATITFWAAEAPPEPRQTTPTWPAPWPWPWSRKNRNFV